MEDVNIRFMHCRVCFTSQKDSNLTFVSVFDNKSKIASQILTNFQLSVMDDCGIHPALICEQCLKFLNLMEEVKASVHRFDAQHFKPLRQSSSVPVLKWRDPENLMQTTVKMTSKVDHDRSNKKIAAVGKSTLGNSEKNDPTSTQVCLKPGNDKKNSVTPKKKRQLFSREDLLRVSATSNNKHFSCMKTQSNPKLFECAVCMKNFTSKQNWELHMTMHSDSKVFECKVCNLKFKYESVLKKHLVVHSDLKLLQCDVCQKCYKRPGCLKSHIKTHSDETRIDSKTK